MCEPIAACLKELEQRFVEIGLGNSGCLHHDSACISSRNQSRGVGTAAIGYDYRFEPPNRIACDS